MPAVSSPARRPRRLDLGCGIAKCSGFIGADRRPLQGVDVVLDFDRSLPFASDSVDLVVMSHSLEHSRDLIATMREVYRVCRHGAQVCIVAPYFQQALNLANPHHRQAFNEHTPRFWTSSAWTRIDPAEFAHPRAGGTWGLSRSDHGDPRIDFRCLKMEFFYFPDYRDLSPAEQRSARKKFVDVCDEVVYNLVVVKQEMPDEDVERLCDHLEAFDPPYVQLRRAQEQILNLDQALGAARQEAAARGAEAAQATSNLERARAELASARADLDRLRGQVGEKTGDVAQKAVEAGLRRAEIQKLRDALNARGQDVHRLTRAVASLAGQLEVHRTRRTARWLQRWQLTDLRDQLRPTFRRLLDDSLIFGSVRGFRLAASSDLRLVPFLGYPIELPRPGLRAVLLAPALDWRLSGGVLGVEIVSPSNQIVAQTVVPLSELSLEVPVALGFTPLTGSGGRFWLRVFVRGAAEPARILEWRSYSPLGLGPARRRAFCGFEFAD
jgi:hypothetical protein